MGHYEATVSRKRVSNFNKAILPLSTRDPKNAQEAKLVEKWDFY